MGHQRRLLRRFAGQERLDGARTDGPTGARHGPAGVQAHPAHLAMATDAGTRERAALSLQASAGNRAVAASLSDIARTHAAGPALAVVGTPASTMAPAPGGVLQIANSATGMRAAGVTSLPAPGAPDVVIGAPLQQTDGRWQATVNSTQVTPDSPTSLFPGPGLHDEDPTATGMAVHRQVTAAASNEIKRGEEEHLLDLEWARHLAYDQVADAVNRVAGSGPATGASSDEARRNAMQQVRSAVPAQARWADGVDPITLWRRVYGQLVAITRERDSNGWHNMSTEIVLDPGKKRQLGVPVADELLRYVDGTTQVGQHEPGPLVQARYNSLPAGPAGTQPANQSQAPQAPAAGGGAQASPQGDFDYKPSNQAYAIRVKRHRA